MPGESFISHSYARSYTRALWSALRLSAGDSAALPRRRWTVVYLLLLSTMLIDVDHLLARPIFDPNRCSVGRHLLHSYPMVGLYVVMLFLPYERWGWPWWLRVLAVGLTLHILTDWQDFYLWLH